MYYYPKRVGLKWEVWMSRIDGTPDPVSKATEYRAVWGISFWRRINALRVASDMKQAYVMGQHNDGVGLR